MVRDNNSEGPSWLNEEYAMSQGLEEMSVDIEKHGEFDSEEDEQVDIVVEEGCQDLCNVDGGPFDSENGVTIDTLQDILSLDLKTITPYDVRNIDFVSVEMAYLFYYWFARVNGFAARKSKVLRNNKGEKLQQTFVCYKQGFREDRGLTTENRKREPKPETRCGCQAKLKVHIDMYSRRWYITYFLDDHNHDLLEEKYYGMLAAHRRMSESDVMQMNNMRKVGINTPHIYGSFANQSGGYERIGFRKKDIYNQVGRQRRLQCLDARAAMQYLSGLGVNDPLMFVRHTTDEDCRLQHLFWCDGTMQMDYKLFGDVLAFDATYGKNKYQCPLVIFSGVNHHNQTTIFASAVIANETEETYIWILEQFLDAMKGKSPISVITDGDLAMRNAIRKVFPNAHHRLCAWHLIRNATTNIGNPAFTAQFKKCMLGDFEIGEFRRKWTEMVSNFGLHDHPWVVELFEKRQMWCTAYIRGNFFAGFRTTSRCEGLHSEIGKFIHSRYNLTEFLQHYHRSLNFMRYREVESDFASIHGDPVLQTHFQSLERSAAKLFTREIFNLFRPILDRSSVMKVIGCKQNFSYFIYIVSKYQMEKRVWHVSYYPSSSDFKCSCQRMESFGLPCDHILAVLVYLNVFELPKSLVLKRWTKSAKDDFRGNNNDVSNFWDSYKEARYLSLMEYYKDISTLACESFDDYNDERDKAINEYQYLKAKKGSQSEEQSLRMQRVSGGLRDPVNVRTKGSRGRKCSSSGGMKAKKKIKCSSCKQSGHNRRSCPSLVRFGEIAESATGIRFPIEEDGVSFDNDGYNADIGQEFFDDDSTINGGRHYMSSSIYNA